MMFRLFCFVVFLGFSVNCNSQEYHITYTGFYEDRNKIIELPVDYHLIISKDNSKFYARSNMKHSWNDMSKRVYYTLSKDRVYYFNSEKSNLIIEELQGRNKLLLTNAKMYDWEITNETMQIDGYLCYKAKAKPSKRFMPKEALNTANYDYSAIAWFTPELSFSHGPDRFVGLPGIIIQVTDFKGRGYKIKSFKEGIIEPFSLPNTSKAKDFLDYLKN